MVNKLKHTALILSVCVSVFALSRLVEAKQQVDSVLSAIEKEEQQQEFDFFKDTNFTETSPIPWKFPPIKVVDYKTTRLQEMAAMWKGTVLEPHTVALLSMLMQEDGTLTAERRHDCGSTGCYAVGIQGHHICHRGTPKVEVAKGKPFRKYCWKGAMKDFEKNYPEFSFDWRVQFQEYTIRMTEQIEAGKAVTQAIQSWNPREHGRLSKVKRHYSVVKAALSI